MNIVETMPESGIQRFKIDRLNISIKLPQYQDFGFRERLRRITAGLTAHAVVQTGRGAEHSYAISGCEVRRDGAEIFLTPCITVDGIELQLDSYCVDVSGEHLIPPAKLQAQFDDPMLPEILDVVNVDPRLAELLKPLLKPKKLHN